MNILHSLKFKTVLFFSWTMYTILFFIFFLGSFRHNSYHPPNPGSSLHPTPQDLGQIYGFGRSPVLPRKRNGLFTNPIRSQHWTYEGTTPSGGGYQTVDARYTALKEAPQSILIKPDAHRHSIEKVTRITFPCKNTWKSSTVKRVFPPRQS